LHKISPQNVNKLIHPGHCSPPFLCIDFHEQFTPKPIRQRVAELRRDINRSKEKQQMSSDNNNANNSFGYLRRNLPSKPQPSDWIGKVILARKTLESLTEGFENGDIDEVTCDILAWMDYDKEEPYFRVEISPEHVTQIGTMSWPELADFLSRDTDEEDHSP
jgi:hypothetical protein